MSIQNLEAVKEQLKPYLSQYLTMQGIKMTSGMFPCIDPKHDDWHGDGGSAGIVPGNRNVFHCFGCGLKGDIFLAAHLLENKPTVGKAFVVENLKHLADTFGVEIPDLHLTEEDLYEMQVKAAYAHASSILLSSDLSDGVQQHLANREWTAETRTAMGIGSVSNFSDYMDRMVKQYGYPVKFLHEIDLSNDKLFNKNNLIFTVCDEHGAPIGFAARRVTYEADQKAWEAEGARLKARLDATPDLTEKQRKEAEDEHMRRKVTKYVNTSKDMKFYQKSKRLFGLHIARKSSPPLWVMEGYPDAATAQDRGMKNVAAVGATAFTRDHVEVLLGLGVKHLIFVLDGDKAGWDGMDRAVRLIEEAVGDRIGLKVELIQMPEGSDDPDRFIRLYGIEEFKNLPRLDIFSWKVKRQLDSGGDPIQLANEAVPLIVNEPNYLQRLAQIQKLAQVTGVDEEFLRAEVMRRLDQEDAKVREETSLVTGRLVTDLKRNPDAAMEILRTSLTQIETIQRGKGGYDPQHVKSAYRYMFDKAKQQKSAIGVKTNLPLFDRYMGGLPRGAGFFSIPGKPNQGKTSLLSNLSWRIPDNNKDVRTIFHTVDDSIDKAIPRILGSKYQLPSKLWQKSGFFLDTHEGQHLVAEKWPQFPQIYVESMTWMDEMLDDERLIVVDINELPGTLTALEGWLKSIRKRFPNDALVCMGDNFALYHYEVASDSEAVRARKKSQEVKRMANAYQTCMLMTAELTKESLKPGVRPRMGFIKDTQGVAYDADANLGIYNDLKDRGDSADLVWFDRNEMVLQQLEGMATMAPRRKPVLEMVIDKSKVSDFDGALYYEFDPVTAELRECTEAEQAAYKAKAEQITSKTMAAQIGMSNAPNKSPF